MAKGDWQFIDSETLGQQIAFDRNSGWLYCRDGTRYSPAELARMTENWTLGKEIPLAVHITKKIFDGEIINVKKK